MENCGCFRHVFGCMRKRLWVLTVYKYQDTNATLTHLKLYADVDDSLRRKFPETGQQPRRRPRGAAQ